jgi:hypothetical protein
MKSMVRERWKKAMGKERERREESHRRGKRKKRKNEEGGKENQIRGKRKVGRKIMCEEREAWEGTPWASIEKVGKESHR